MLTEPGDFGRQEKGNNKSNPQSISWSARLKEQARHEPVKSGEGDRCGENGFAVFLEKGHAAQFPEQRQQKRRDRYLPELHAEIEGKERSEQRRAVRT